MSAPVRVGVIGVGAMGATHVRLLAREVSGAAVTAVHDLDSERAASAGCGARLFDDPFELIDDAGVDAVLVASADDSHEPFVLASLRAGKPVLCEKPLAPTLDSCRRIVEAELALRRRLLTVGFMRRDDAGFAALRAARFDGRVGEPLVLHCVHRNAASVPGAGADRLITSSAVHEFDVVRWLLDDEIVRVAARQPRCAGRPADARDPLLLWLELASGILVDIEVFTNAGYGYEVRCELVGTTGTLMLDAPAATVLRSLRSAGRGIADDWLDRFAGAYRTELQRWITAIAGNSSTHGASAWDGYVATAVADAALHALRTGVSVGLELAPRPAFYAS